MVERIYRKRREKLSDEEIKRRADRFTWQPSDLKVYSGLEEIEKEHEKVILYYNETPKDNN